MGDLLVRKSGLQVFRRRYVTSPFDSFFWQVVNHSGGGLCAISCEEGRANKGDHEGPVGPSFVSVCHTLPHKLPPLAKSCDRTGL